MQGLQSGNYSFQARAVDAASNVGAPTAAYAFAVDAALPLQGAAAQGDPWFSGWHLYSVLGGAAAALILLAALAALFLLRPQQELRAPRGLAYRRQCSGQACRGTPPGRGGTPPEGDPALAVALQRSLVEQRLGAAARVEADLRNAIAQSLEARSSCLGAPQLPKHSTDLPSL